MNRLGRPAVTAMCAALTLVVVGCSSGPADQPELGNVTGTVTMDGKPLANVQVVFSPQAGRSSTGTTDASGNYRLFYTVDTEGAKIGNHKVEIVTPIDANADVDANDPRAGETIPAKYNTETTLSADVKAGDNTFDFDLESE